MMRKLTVLVLLLFFTACAGTRTEKSTDWVEETLANMTIEQKVGQMMAPSYVPRFYNKDDGQFTRLINLVRNYHVGGVMFFRGMPYEVARSVERLQQEADIPLLVMADVEWGLSMRVKQATHFLQNMAIGATAREDFAYEMGKITATEAKAIGVHVGYAPVMDVNNNPDNLIVNTRSFGADPTLVSKLGAAYIRGLQENGLYATAKHYPGHGDTDVDSHLSLAKITASKERVRDVELAPFRAAVAAGVKCVMVGHITFSDFPQMEGRPATLDSYFIQDVLRKEMGFQGLVFSDAMEMGGITGNYWSGAAAVMAINAGVDMVLIPPNFEATFEFVAQAVKEGRIDIERIDRAVRRILQAKRQLGLENRPVLDLENLEGVISNSEHLRKAEEIANASMTLLRDEENVFPLQAEDLDQVLVVTITDEEGGSVRGIPLNQAVQQRIPLVKTAFVDPRSTEAEINEIITTAEVADAVIVGVFVTWGSYKGSITLPDTTVHRLKELFEVDKAMAVISFGSPYVLRQIPKVPSYLCAYETTSLAVRAATRAIFGEIPLQAKLPVSIPGFHKMGDGLERPVRRMELVTEIEDETFQDAYAVLEQAIEDSVFPGAQVAVVRNGKLIATRGFGRHTYDPSSPKVTSATIYDLASVTKVVATTVSAMYLWERGKLLLDIPVKSYIPKFTGHGKDSITIHNLLTHTSGLQPFTDLWNKAQDRASALQYIYDMPLVYPSGDSMVYSDLGLITLGKVLETVTGRPLDQLTHQTFYEPLGMNHTMFNPPKGMRNEIAPTEIGGHMLRGLIWGDVHDENAFFLGGVSAHAGLFSSAEDLAAFAQMLINGGSYKHRRFFSPATIKYWTSRQNMPEWSERALGWDRPSEEHSSAGDYFSSGSFGHLGFTGTSFWIDPNRKIAIILLTNRVHPTRARGGMYQVRRNFHNAAMKALLESLGEEVPAVKGTDSNF